VLTWRGQPTNPPPFNVLRSPYWMGTTLLSIPFLLGYWGEQGERWWRGEMFVTDDMLGSTSNLSPERKTAFPNCSASNLMRRRKAAQAATDVTTSAAALRNRARNRTSNGDTITRGGALPSTTRPNTNAASKSGSKDRPLENRISIFAAAPPDPVEFLGAAEPNPKLGGGAVSRCTSLLPSAADGPPNGRGGESSRKQAAPAPTDSLPEMVLTVASANPRSRGLAPSPASNGAPASAALKGNRLGASHSAGTVPGLDGTSAMMRSDSLTAPLGDPQSLPPTANGGLFSGNLFGRLYSQRADGATGHRSPSPPPSPPRSPGRPKPLLVDSSPPPSPPSRPSSPNDVGNTRLFAASVPDPPASECVCPARARDPPLPVADGSRSSLLHGCKARLGLVRRPGAGASGGSGESSSPPPQRSNVRSRTKMGVSRAAPSGFRTQSGQYMRSSYFIAWSHKHPESTLADRLTESILRHENDFMDERKPRAKIESIEGLVTMHLTQMETALGKRMAAIAEEQTVKLAALQHGQRILQQQLAVIGDKVGVDVSASALSTMSQFSSGSPLSRHVASLHSTLRDSATPSEAPSPSRASPVPPNLATPKEGQHLVKRVTPRSAADGTDRFNSQLNSGPRVRLRPEGATGDANEQLRHNLAA